MFRVTFTSKKKGLSVLTCWWASTEKCKNAGDRESDQVALESCSMCNRKRCARALWFIAPRDSFSSASRNAIKSAPTSIKCFFLPRPFRFSPRGMIYLYALSNDLSRRLRSQFAYSMAKVHFSSRDVYALKGFAICAPWHFRSSREKRARWREDELQKANGARWGGRTGHKFIFNLFSLSFPLFLWGELKSRDEKAMR